MITPSEPARRALTLKDVARVAGISPITVSRAIRAPHLVTEETRARVDAAIAQTGYVPDGAAAQLASGSSRLLAAIVPTLDAPYFVDALKGLADMAAAAGCSLTIGQTNYSEDRGDRLVRDMLAARPRGVGLFGADVSEVGRRLLRQADIPVVEAWELVADPVGLCIGFSHEAALRTLTECLLSEGRRSLIFAARDPTQRRGAQRYAGYATAMRVNGLEPRLVWREADTAVAAGAAVASAILAMGEPVDGIICAADNMALGVIAELTRRGRDVPRDIAVTGFGDLDFAAVAHPSISTVHVPNRLIGEQAAAFLLAEDWRHRLACEPRVVDLGFRIVGRASANLGTSSTRAV